MGFCDFDDEEINDYTSMTKKEARRVLKTAESRYCTTEVISFSEIIKAKRVLND